MDHVKLFYWMINLVIVKTWLEPSFDISLICIPLFISSIQEKDRGFICTHTYILFKGFNLMPFITKVEVFSSILINFVIAFDDAPIREPDVWAVHDISDHYSVCCTAFLGNLQPVPIVRTFRDFGRLNEATFDNKLCSVS